MTTTATDFLAHAQELLRERGKTYDRDGREERSMARIVAIYNTLHGAQMTEAQGWSFMLCLKMARLFSAPDFHRDSAEDAIAYSALMAECMAHNPDIMQKDSPAG